MQIELGFQAIMPDALIRVARAGKGCAAAASAGCAAWDRFSRRAARSGTGRCPPAWRGRCGSRTVAQNAANTRSLSGSGFSCTRYTVGRSRLHIYSATASFAASMNSSISFSLSPRSRYWISGRIAVFVHDDLRFRDVQFQSTALNAPAVQRVRKIVHTLGGIDQKAVFFPQGLVAREKFCSPCCTSCARPTE